MSVGHGCSALAAAVALLGGCAIETRGLALGDDGGARDAAGIDERTDAGPREGGAPDGDAPPPDAPSGADAGPPDAGPSCDPVACDDGVFCNGIETCVDGACHSPGDPCVASELLCDEAMGACVTCLSRADCPPGAPGEWGSCSYSDACDESGARTRAVDEYQCEMGSCAPIRITETDASGCARDTDGDDCTRDGLSCTYDVCDDGVCTHPCVAWCTCWSSGGSSGCACGSD